MSGAGSRWEGLADSAHLTKQSLFRNAHDLQQTIVIFDERDNTARHRSPRRARDPTLGRLPLRRLGRRDGRRGSRLHDRARRRPPPPGLRPRRTRDALRDRLLRMKVNSLPGASSFAIVGSGQPRPPQPAPAHMPPAAQKVRTQVALPVGGSCFQGTLAKAQRSASARDGGI